MLADEIGEVKIDLTDGLLSEVVIEEELAALNPVA
jgi:hypothetical protein